MFCRVYDWRYIDLNFFKRRFTGIKKAFADTAEFPADSVGNIPNIEIKGGYECTVSGCRIILDFSNELISFDGGPVTVTVRGTCLSLSEFVADCMSVRGHISSVEITER